MRNLQLLGGWPDEIERAKKEKLEVKSHFWAPFRINLPRFAGKTRYVHAVNEAGELVNTLKSTPLSAIGIDSEYTFSSPPLELRSKKPWYDVRSQIPICVSLAAWAEGAGGEGYVLRAVVDVRKPEIIPYLDEILKIRVPFIFHNIKAELFSFWAFGLDPDFPSIYDTNLAASCLNLGFHHKRSLDCAFNSEFERIQSEAELSRKKDHWLSLNGQCAHYGLGYPFSGSKSGLQQYFLRLNPLEPLNQEAIEYAASDAEWTLRLCAAQQPDIVRQGLQNHLYSVEFPFAIANARMEWRGVFVSEEDRKKLHLAAHRASEHYAKKLLGFGIDPPGSREKFLALMEKEGLLEEFWRDGKLCAKKDLLELLEPLHPAIRFFRLHKQYQRLAGEEWLRGSMTGADGRIHPSHGQLGAATGRNTCKTPNIVGIGKILRPVVSAPPGRAILELDYGQIEVAVAAAEHGDRDLVDAYNSGDVYSAMAQRFYESRISEEEKALSPEEFRKRRPELRDNMKTFVLAVIYNVQPKTIANRFGLSVEEAERERNRFLDLFPALKERLEESVAFGGVRGYATTVSGLRRKIERGKRANSWVKNFLRNTPIQGSAAVVFKLAVVLLDREFRNSDTWLILPVHDAIVIECPLAQINDVAERAKFLMKHALQTYYPQLQPKIEVNRSHPECWNKDGQAESLDKFLADPTFQIERQGKGNFEEESV